MSKILVTGGTGMVGKHLQEILPDAIYVGSNIDLRDYIAVDTLFNKLQPTHVIHLAAKVGGIQDNILKQAEYFDDNILINTHVLKASYKYKVERFVGILSTCIYPDTVQSYPMEEKDLFSGPPAKTNFSYGYAKRQSRSMHIMNNIKLNTTILPHVIYTVSMITLTLGIKCTLLLLF